MDAASTALNSLLYLRQERGTARALETPKNIEEKVEHAAHHSKAKSGKSGSEGNKSGSTSTETTSASASKAEKGATTVDKAIEETDTDADQTVAKAVEHDHITSKHETRERDVIEREVHQDHYHTTIQPLQDREVQETKHDFEETPIEYRSTEKDDGAAKAKAASRLSEFHDTVEEEKTEETRAKDDTVLGEHVHHHLHETVQPVIYKEIVKSSVTHVTHPIKETVHEHSKDHGVTEAKTISVDEFKHRLGGEKTKEVDPEKPAI
ncbi:hypothetical protein LTR53_002223 [Teratosphaeriaceae sp. CCFEE 6253]|nr:hypothetical protein LTR53_002223 [Teratosphaeriaceae sp. CCFEE 6253]